METDWGEAPREDIGQEALEHVHDAPAWKRTHAPAAPAAALADASAAAAPATPAAAPLQPRPVAVPAVVPPLADATPAAAPLQPRPVAMPAIVPPLAEAGAPARRPHCQWVCTEEARPRRTADTRAMRIMGPTAGVAQEVWGRREKGTVPLPHLLLSSLMKDWPVGPMDPLMLMGMTIRRMRVGHVSR